MEKKFLSAAEMKTRLLRGDFDARLMQFYGTSGDGLTPYRRRIADAADCFTAKYGNLPIRVFSVSGRTELGGNHTDHQHGCVLAAAVDLKTTAKITLNHDGFIRVQSEGYPLVEVDVNDLTIHPEEMNTTAALIRGVAAAFAQRGAVLQGFDAQVSSTVLPGSGLSSSAAFEVLIGSILNTLFFLELTQGDIPQEDKREEKEADKA